MATVDFEQEVERNYRHNAVVNLLDGTFFWFSVNFVAPQTVLPLYVSHFTDSKLLIGLLSTISAGGWLLPQLFTANWVQRLPRKKAAPVNVGLFSERLPVFLLVPSVWLATRSPQLALVTFFALYTWQNVGMGFVAVGWQDMLAKVIPLDRRGRFLGLTQAVGTGAGVLGASAAAWLLDRYSFPTGYLYCFAAAAVLSALSWFFLALTREPPQVSQEPAVSQWEYWRRLPAVLRNDVNFQRYLLSRSVITLGSMATGFLVVYAAQRWRLPDDWAAGFTVSMLVGQALSNFLFGMLADRKGHKLVLELSALSIAAAVGLACVSPAPLWFYVVFALVGISAGGLMLSSLMIAMEFSSPSLRPTYIGLNNTVSGIVASTAPLLGGWLAKATGYRAFFAMACAAGLAGFALMRWTVRDPRQAKAAFKAERV